jgi:predicted dehydrogenase
LDPLRIGVVGCGNISGIYFKNLNAYKPTQVVACADLDLDRAGAAASKHGVPKVLTTEALLADPDVELVLNLTVPKAHAAVAFAALNAGKHVYNEKPLAIQVSEGSDMLALADRSGLRVGCAPDTFLGGGLQTCRKLIDDGAIGEPVAAQAFMLCHGHESWHPSPEFYYEVGGGPMFDMGPYYLTALVHLIGPVRRVAGSARITFPTREITSQPKHGQIITVETPTHLSGILDFANGAIGEITTSFDIWHSVFPPIMVHGSEGSMLVPDPNGFGGEVKIRGSKDDDWRSIALTHGFQENSRGIGVMDMAYAIRNNRRHRASGALAQHVLELMDAVGRSSDEGKHVDVSPNLTRPEPMPQNVPADDLLG